MKSKAHIITAACVAALVCCAPSLAFAASQKSPSPGASPSPAASASPAAAAAKEKAPRAIPFRGTATAVDQSAKSFTIAGKKESRVYKVTDKTKVMKKDGSTATFADLSDNTSVTGSYWKHDDGTMEAKSLKIGEPAKEKTAAKTDAAASPSPSPKKK